MFTQLSNALQSEPTVSISMATQWIQKQSMHANETGLVHSTIKASEHPIRNSDQLKRSRGLNVPLLTHVEIQDLDASSDFVAAFTHKNNPLIFTTYITSAYNKCCTAKQSKALRSYHKIFLYSLLISSGFIYYSEYTDHCMKGLKQIYDILIDMNHDNQLKKDLISALESKIYWTEIERKLIKSVIHFAVRINIFIQTIQKQLMNTHYKDGKQTNLQYLNMGWIPTYNDGYYFGKINENTCKYPKLSIKNFRNVMDAQKAPYRICIDGLVIHTYDLVNTGLYVEKHAEYVHHWLSSTDWIDFDYVEKFRIYVRVLTNGHSYALKVNLYDTIKTVKSEIQKRERVSMAMLRVQYNDQRLVDNVTLYDYNICDNCWLNISLLTFNPLLNLIS